MRIVAAGFLAVLSALALLGAGGRAQAQYHEPFRGAMLPPFEVMTIVRSMGFDPISRPVLNGPFYVVRAIDDEEIVVRIVVDARSGHVVRVTESGPAYAREEMNPRVAARGIPPDMSYRPYRNVPPPAVRAAPPQLAARPPLPRPAPPESRPAATPPIAIPDPDRSAGKSIPAPVANKAAPGADAAETGSTDDATPRAEPDTVELKPTVIVPVAPLE